MDPDDGRAPSYGCHVDTTLDHPPVEAAHYRVEVTSPVADREQTAAFDSYCESSAETTSCSDEYHPH